MQLTSIFGFEEDTLKKVIISDVGKLFLNRERKGDEDNLR